MRRFVLLVSVVALLSTGCSRLTPAGAAAAAAESAIASADKLMAAKQYEKAADAYLKAAAKTEGVAHEGALDKAALATTRRLASAPLPEQLAALEALRKRTPSGMLPLAGHNWLCERLLREPEAIVTAAKATQKAAQDALDSGTSSAEAAAAAKAAEEEKASSSGKKKSSRRKKTSSSEPAATPASATPPASAVATYTVPDGEELKRAAATLPALGQPDEMKQLYESLAVLCGAVQECEKARAAYVAPGSVYAHRRALREANRTLTTALNSVERRLDSAR